MFNVDGNLAGVEGLAAGTGLLTGDVARAVPVEEITCPVCDHPAGVVIIDLVVQQVTRRCEACGHRWVSAEAIRHDVVR